MISSQGQRITYLVLTMFQKERKKRRKSLNCLETRFNSMTDGPTFLNCCLNILISFSYALLVVDGLSRASLALQCKVLNVDMLFSIDLNINLCILNVFYTCLVHRTKLMSDHMSTWTVVLFSKEKFHVQKQHSSENTVSIMAHLIINPIKKE